MQDRLAVSLASRFHAHFFGTRRFISSRTSGEKCKTRRHLLKRIPKFCFFSFALSAHGARRHVAALGPFQHGSRRARTDRHMKHVFVSRLLVFPDCSSFPLGESPGAPAFFPQVRGLLCSVSLLLPQRRPCSIRDGRRDRWHGIRSCRCCRRRCEGAGP